MEIIIGVGVSLLVQLIKKFAKTSEIITLASVLVISLAAGYVYFVFGNTAYWQALIQILGFSGAFYAFVIKRFDR